MLRFSTAALERRYAQETHLYLCQRDMVYFRAGIILYFAAFLVLTAYFSTDRCATGGTERQHTTTVDGH